MLEPRKPTETWREPGQIPDAAYLRSGTLRYDAEGREIVGRGGTGFNNRPLYCDLNSEGVVLAGDRPLVRLLAQPYVHGVFTVAIVRGGKGRWFHEYTTRECRYRCGRMSWRLSDPLLRGVSATLEVVPLRAAGFAVRLQASGLLDGDRAVWSFGGAKQEANPREAWDPIMCGNPHVRKTGDPRKPQRACGIAPEWCSGNEAVVSGQAFGLRATSGATRMAQGRADRSGRLHIADASASADPSALAQSTAAALPTICGVIELRSVNDEIHWVVEATESDVKETTPHPGDPLKAFEGAKAYLAGIERVQTDTPDHRLDAAVAAACHLIDGNWQRESPLFRHGCMAYAIPFLGWRVLGGATVFGWHDRIRSTAAHYAARQIKNDEERTHGHADESVRLCHEGPQSRFWGRGRLAPNPGHMYNTQTQFFDQVVRDWRWTADPEMEAILRPALELHLEWARECFDPDDDGLYESYINTLPTDSIWYNGGGSVEESAYAYSGHQAAADMARRAGDAEAAERHRARAAKIQKALRDVLWLKDRGHFGLYVEQGGHRRVHADAWVHSEILPIDAGMTTTEEALQALYYTEWALERIRLPFGGVLCQPSNWTPSPWSVRDIFGGDLFHLALAYFRTGLGDEGWDVLSGAMLESAYAGAVPGGFSHIGAGTDFADNPHMFARSVVEGLFGFEPDYPNGAVAVRPSFPLEWPAASIQTPDFSLDYRQVDDTDRYRLTLTQSAGVRFRIPVCAECVRQVTLAGQAIAWQAEPGFGCTWISLQTSTLATAELTVELSGRLPRSVPVAVDARVGESMCLRVDHGVVERWRDLHGVLANVHVDGAVLRGTVAQKPGHHLVLAECRCGELARWQTFKLHVTDPEAESQRSAKTPCEAPKNAVWECFDLAVHCNGDVRTIFKQQYLSPRPPTCSVRLGVDGYSAWTFPYWKWQPPEIDLSRVQELTAADGRIVTPHGVPFWSFAEDRNIAFTSLWDNWPQSITVPLERAADVIWLLVCGSTFPMQLRIANAEFRFAYADGVVETLPLVPPLNFWCLSPWGGKDYSYATDAFCLPIAPPPQVQLGNNCRAMVLSWKLRRDKILESVTLEALSQDVVIGLMSVSLMMSPP
ncbi:MAG: DUF4450 domain-containing protein [Lentisphaerae bacterium]|nr:DUF4450 domain-containing protein [Lentisphaerota bacterium]